MTERLSRRRLLEYSGVTALVLAGCTGGSGGDRTTTAGDDATPATETATAQQPTGESSVELAVRDQETTDRSVTVAEVAVDAEGWLVIHPAADGGGPDGTVVLASRMLAADAYEDVELSLDVVRANGSTVYAMLHYDDPADGEFTFPERGDPPVTTDGSPVIEPFRVDVAGAVTPALSVPDQQTDGSTVSASSAAIDETGWLVVHPAADGGGPDGDVVLAKRRLAPGLYADQSLSLSSPIAADQTLYGMLHYDDPADGEFTFPERGDPPVTTDGSPVVVPFDVTVQDGAGPADNGTATETVEAVNTAFEPVQLSVAPGTTVRWVNRDAFDHTVTSARFHDAATDWDLSASLAGNGGSVEYTFEDAGIYEYTCTVHGRKAMCGVVLVGDASLDATLPCESEGDGGSDGGDDDGGVY